MKIAHIVAGDTKVGAISSVKRIFKNYSFENAKMILISYGAPIKIDGYENNKGIYYLNLKCNYFYRKFFDQPWKLYYVVHICITFITDIIKMNCFCKKHKVSIIHTHYYIDSLHFCFLSILGYKFVTHIRGILNKKMFFGIPFYLFRYFIYKFSDAVIGVSKASLDVFERDSEKNYLIYNGLEEKLPALNTELEEKTKDSFIVASVIRFQKEKGVMFLAETILEFLRLYPKENIKFLLIAPIQNQNGELLRERFFKILEENNLLDYFIYYESFPDYSYFMPYIDILFHPTLQREGFGNVVLEAHWFGKPVISTPCLGVNDIIEDGLSGYILREVKIKDAVSNILKIARNKQLLKSMSDKAYEISHLSKFTITTSMSLLHEVYISI